MWCDRSTEEQLADALEWLRLVDERSDERMAQLKAMAKERDDALALLTDRRSAFVRVCADDPSE